VPLRRPLARRSIRAMPAISTLTRPDDSPLPDGFASTEWSLVLAASSAGGVALDRLCRTYWRPVYVYIRATGVPRTEAEDATQDFFADMLRREWLKLVDRERGSFRAFLRTSVRLFLNNRWRHAHAQKRRADRVVPLDAEACERELAALAATDTNPAEIYERSWADCVLQAALARLANEQHAAGRSEQFQELHPYLTSAPAPGDYERIANRFKWSPGQVAVGVHRLSRRFAEVIRAEVAGTLAERQDVEIELRHLLRLVSRQA
jgi:DNA-directed RNA polymerase specialized sigma24 family protein